MLITNPIPDATSSWKERIKALLSPHVYIPFLIICGIGAFAFFECILPALRDYFAFYTAPKGVIEEDPVKAPTNAAPFVFVGTHGLYTHKYVYIVEPVFSYAITARVLHVGHYYSDTNHADIVPFDMGLGWRLMSEPYSLRHYFLFHHANNWGRSLQVEVKGDWREIPPVYLQEMRSGVHYSNNHLIPKDDAVFQTLSKANAGDFISMTGYLVDFTSPELPGFKWKTSRYAREDAAKSYYWGDGESVDHLTTCDTFFVTDAKILKHIEDSELRNVEKNLDMTK